MTYPAGSLAAHMLEWLEDFSGTLPDCETCPYLDDDECELVHHAEPNLLACRAVVTELEVLGCIVPMPVEERARRRVQWERAAVRSLLEEIGA